jgi:hypothetical protein
MPLGYQCCLAGHDAALVQASRQIQPSPQSSQVAVRIEPALKVSSFDGLEASTFISADPPGTTPLRI